MNVLFLDQFSDLGGAQQCVLDLVPAIEERGWRMSWAGPGDGDMTLRLRERGVDVHSLPIPGLASGRKRAVDFLRFGTSLPRLTQRIRAVARGVGADLFYVNGPRVLPAAAWVARSMRRPLIFHCHSHLATGSAAWLAGRSVEFSRARVIACCRFVARPLWPYVDPGRLYVIYSGVNAAGCGRRERAPGAGFRIGMIGRVSPDKGQAEFVSAATLVHARFPESTFVVCGGPLFRDREAERYDAEVRKQAQGLPVEFTGWRDDPGRTLESLDMLVVPSVREGVPRVILEAYSARVPVVAFAAGGIPEILHDGETGFLVEPPEPEPLARRLLEVLQHEEQLHEIAERAHEIWAEQFTVARYQSEVMAVIARAANG